MSGVTWLRNKLFGSNALKVDNSSLGRRCSVVSHPVEYGGQWNLSPRRLFQVESFWEESCRSIQQVCVKHDVKHEENEKYV